MSLVLIFIMLYPACLFESTARESCSNYTRVYNCSGEANGTAYVQFENAAMAKDAFERYNDVALDGKPMKIAFDSGSSRVLSSGIRYIHGNQPIYVSICVHQRQLELYQLIFLTLV